jgi:hypothetical protein
MTRCLKDTSADIDADCSDSELVVGHQIGSDQPWTIHVYWVCKCRCIVDGSSERKISLSSIHEGKELLPGAG